MNRALINLYISVLMYNRSVTNFRCSERGIISYWLGRVQNNTKRPGWSGRAKHKRRGQGDSV